MLVLSLNLGQKIQLLLSKKKEVVQSVKLYRNTLWSDGAAMPAFRRLSVLGWLIVALAAASVETHAPGSRAESVCEYAGRTQLLDRRVCLFERHCGNGRVSPTGRYRGYA